MKTFTLAAVSQAAQVAQAGSPIQKAIQLLAKLQAEVAETGKKEGQAFDKFFEWCEDYTRERKFEIKDGKSGVETFSARAEKAQADAETAAATITEFAADVAEREQQIAAAQKLRDEEHSHFLTQSKELSSTIDALARAGSIIKQSMSSPKAAELIQKSGVLGAFKSLVLGATQLSYGDRNRLTSFIESINQPEVRAYEGHSGGIVGIIEDLQSKAEDELMQLQKEEQNRRHSFEMLKQDLETANKHANADIIEQRKVQAAAKEEHAGALKDLTQTKRDLEEDQKGLRSAQSDCMQKASQFQESKESRAKEIQALVDAQAVLTETTGAANDRTYESLLQTSTKHTNEAISMLKNEAKTIKNTSFSQFVTSLSSTLRVGEPFGKVKSMISNMVAKLEKEAEADATQKAFCDEETAKTNASKAEKQASIDKISASVDRKTARSTKLREQITTLNKELKNLATLQSEMDSTRAEERKNFTAYSIDLKGGVEGLRIALKVLREYYAEEEASSSLIQEPVSDTPPSVSVHVKRSEGASGIVGLLEVAESDLIRGLAEAESTESESERIYEEVTQENKISTTTKQQDVKYKSAEVSSLNKEVADLTGDRDGLAEELSALMDYSQKLLEQCTVMPESYEERKARREREVEGLKQALEILESDNEGSDEALVQIQHHATVF